ncbi:MAG TPA: DUF885 domain-containing protein [Steroidobacteraceae bacterium]|nr:DUF885 domain-containing protein [Steroidobacteraceae bacterium]
MISHHGIRRAAFIGALVSFVLLAGCGRKEEQAPAQGDPAALLQKEWETYRDGFVEDFFKAHPVFAVRSGRHDFDGQLPDWSATGIAAEIQRLHQARDRAAAFDMGLTDAQKFERNYLIARIDRDLFWLEVVGDPFRNPTFYFDWNLDDLDPSPYLTREYAPLDQRLRGLAGYLRSIPRIASEIKTNLRLPMAQSFVERAIAGFGGFADFYDKDLPQVFAQSKDEALRKDLAEASKAATTAMRDLAKHFEDARKSATQDYALGPEKFARMLAMTEGVTTPISELEAMGRADLKRNQEAVREACAKFAPGATVQACFAKMNANKPDGGPVEGARGQLAGLRQFIIDKQILTIPSDDQALVAEAPPFNRANFAYIDVPGPYEKGVPATYYISPPDPSWSKEVQRDYLPGRADLLFTSVHEVWPGHFLQFLHSNRSGSIVGQLFVGYAYAEGWAHYGEEMMWEMGLRNGDPETHIGQLSNALLRDARFLSAIGLHTAGMSVVESERLFREEAYQDEGSARQQARRGTYDPAYLNYTMGKLMIRKLRADWTASRGGQTSWKAFHDEFLSHGGPNIPQLRVLMLGNSEGSLF